MGFKCRINIKVNGFCTQMHTNTHLWREKRDKCLFHFSMKNGTVFIKLSSLRRLHQLHSLQSEKKLNDKCEKNNNKYGD